MSVRRALAAILLAAALGAAGGCGYHDDNPAAARRVAQAYLDAVAAGDGVATCRVVAADQQGLLAARGGGDCAAGAVALSTSRARRRAGAPTLDVLASTPIANFDVPRYGMLILLRIGSIWRVVAGPDIHG